jgi:cytochrome c-type biogenesis protein CcmH/NrfF
MEPTDPDAAGQKLADDRKRALSQQVRSMVTAGGRIESQSDFEAVIATGNDVNHTLHAILTVATCLLWGIPWAVVAATGGVKRQLVTVDEFGDILVQRIETKR